MSRLFKIVVYYTTLLVTMPVWLPIMLGLLLVFSFINWELDPVNHQNHDEGED